MDYRQKAVDNIGTAAVAEAEAAGVPVPFWGIDGRITSLTGTIEINVQFKDQPDDEKMAELRQFAASLIGHEIIADSLKVTLCWDPYQWAGHTST